MDRNTLIGFLLIGAIFLVYYQFNQSNLPEQTEQQTTKVDSSSTAASEQPTAELEERSVAPSAAIIDSVLADSIKEDLASKQYGQFSTASDKEELFTFIENDKLRIKFSNKGGRIYKVTVKDHLTHDSLPLTLFNGDATDFEYSFASDGKVINTQELFFETAGKVLKTDAGKQISYRLYTADRNGYLEQVYTLPKGKYMLDYQLNLVGLKNVIQKNRPTLDLRWESDLQSHEKSLKNERRYTNLEYRFWQDDVDELSETSEEDEEKITTPLHWVSFKQQFFNATLIAEKSFENAVVSLNYEERSATLKTLKAELVIPYGYGQVENFPMRFYLGPNHYQTLANYEIELENIIPLGWPVVRQVNKYVIINMFNFLEKYVGNYGLIILILTIIIKIALFPLTYRTYLSGAKMKLVKPELDAIKEKHEGDQQKIGVEQMKLFRQVGANPLGGCLPMLLQMPILIAMFYFFPASIELRQESFLWATDLSSYDSIYNFPEGFTIPFYGDHVSLFTLLMAITTIIYTKTNAAMTGQSASMPQMKMMMYMMPVMMIFIFNDFSAALTYYYFLQNLVSFAQQWIIKKFFIDEEEVRRKLSEKKNKPQKKSKFQTRMEKLARNQQDQSKKKKKK